MHSCHRVFSISCEAEFKKSSHRPKTRRMSSWVLNKVRRSFWWDRTLTSLLTGALMHSGLASSTLTAIHNLFQFFGGSGCGKQAPGVLCATKRGARPSWKTDNSYPDASRKPDRASRRGLAQGGYFARSRTRSSASPGAKANRTAQHLTRGSYLPKTGSLCLKDPRSKARQGPGSSTVRSCWPGGRWAR